MATVTKGRTFISGETVTPSKLNDLVDAATVTLADGEVTTDKIADGAITQAKINSGVTLVPAGAVLPFAMNSAPTGWLACNGSAVSRTTYATLFSAIGTTYGSGDGSSTFALPDLRGLFVRGSGSQTISGVSYAAGTFGAKQQDAMQGHRHTLLPNFRLHDLSAANYILGGTPNVQLSPADGTGVGNPSTDTVNGTPRTAAETRPVNIAMLYCIKF